jgi:indole-3-glycerol phosphate synthase
MFVKTDTILDKILAHKVTEVAQAKSQVSLADIRRQAEAQPPTRDFVAALHRDTVALIAEVKKASPSKGVLIEEFDAVRLATIYAQNGAAALSVLTDAEFFQGRLDYLTAAREASGLSALRKDFTIDAYQVYEARAAGADAILLIAMALEDSQIADLQALAHGMGMATLVEVHNEEELGRVLRLGSRLIGVNNRDLRTFQEDLTISERLASLMPPDVTFVCESAIRSADDVRRMGGKGAHAVLVGEGLVKANDIGVQVRLLSRQQREVVA